jgi:hypothetical protein
MRVAELIDGRSMSRWDISDGQCRESQLLGLQPTVEVTNDGLESSTLRPGLRLRRNSTVTCGNRMGGQRDLRGMGDHEEGS